MAQFWAIIRKYWPTYAIDCKWIILKGNHEERITRAIEHGPDELVSLMDEFPPDYKYWNDVIPFLTVFEWGGVEFCHYFQNTNGPRPIGTARQLLMKCHKSRVAGHMQGFDYAEMPSGSDRMIQALIAGSCYYHDEVYKAHSNNHFRGTVLLKDVRDGMFDISRYSVESLAGEYGKT